MNILYLNAQAVLGETGRAMRRRGHDLALQTDCAAALQALRNGRFDAVVIEEDDDPEILHFTVQAHASQPALPIFVANTWGQGLLRAIEQFVPSREDCEDDPAYSPTDQADSMSAFMISDEDSSSITLYGEEHVR